MLAEVPMYIDDTPNIALNELRAKARRLHHDIGLDLVMVDYLQLVQWSGPVPGCQPGPGCATRGLKALARELEVPVVALSQLSRQAEQRESREPRLSPTCASRAPSSRTRTS